MTTAGDGYHHGDLPNALRRAAVEVIDERGLGNFSLREVARRAGVSHTAPAHHFGDMRGLLTSLAQEGFRTLRDSMLAAAEPYDVPADRLTAIGVAYVELATTHHAHCEVMFRDDLVHGDDPDLSLCGIEAYTVLEDTVRGIIEGEGLDVELDDATWLCWTTMQGLVQLAPNIAKIVALRGEEPPPTSDLVRRFTAVILAGLRNR